MDESLEALAKLLHCDGPVSYDGEHVRFEAVELHPETVQDPLPVYVGGNHPNALRRAIHHGQGWLPAGMDPGQIEERLRGHESTFEDVGRSPEEIEIAPQLVACIGETTRAARSTFAESQMYEHNKSLADSTLKDQSLEIDDIVEHEPIGTPDDVIDTLNTFVDVGVTEFPGMIFVANAVDELESQMELFAEEVMPSFT
jgi:alkanesulfonate monooxygenase SsuD/methylene tetrahydromethanopterin reductase-like flavin-dependent oxidoreductase (luciferase family)